MWRHVDDPDQDGGRIRDDDFDYQNTGLTDPSGNALQANGNFVTTSLSTKAATFDFDITDGTYRTVEIEPLNASELTAAGYTGGSWSCKSGGVATPFMTTYDIVDMIGPAFVCGSAPMRPCRASTW